ncbi:MAG: polyamine aminopropyltransferase [Bacillaceae bacterium]|nr:polyamine aminopropyltransferase [Bacillaceae bacterium]
MHGKGGCLKVQADIWFTEPHSRGFRTQLRIERVVHNEKSEFQDITIVETTDFGRALLLDGIVQVTEKDHFVYNEMISHIPCATHPNPEKVLIIGGGDGGAAAEILKYEKVKQIDMVEIDERVVAVSEEFLPSIAAKVRDPRINLIFKDGMQHVKEKENEYDIIIVDSSDPVGPAARLFERPFYEDTKRALKKDGILVCQSESPFFYEDILAKVSTTLQDMFSVTRTYLGTVPTYPAGVWSFTLASDAHDPLDVDESSLVDLDTRYYSPEIFKSVFSLPKFVRELVNQKR